MQNDPDYQMALHLQQQYNLEFNSENPSPNLTYNEKKKKAVNNSKSLIDPSWEVIDPTPNIFILFVQFNEKFFWNKLGSVAVSWSKRMTTCAGICSYQGRAGLCKITLSEPLLKLRPRKDLVETLLHEMIHAYLFVTHNDKDRDGHGPEFHKHMYRINAGAGTNITVYHDFHDEVRLYQQHWWRCDGPCQKRPPYFGMVRRAMNRAPGPNDRWWAQHQQTCGGNYIKVKEPEKNNKKPERNNNKASSNKNPKKLNSPKKNSPSKNLPDIRNYLPVVNNNIQTINSVESKGSLGTKNKNGTVVLNPKNSAKDTDLQVSSVIASSDNIVGFSKDAKVPVKNNVEIFSGPGRKLSNSSVTSNGSTPDYNLVRNHWANKFSTPGTSTGTSTNTVKRKSLSFETEVNKKVKPEPFGVTCPNCNKFFVDSEINAHLDTCLNADDSIKSEFSNESFTMVECPVCKTVMEEESLYDHLDECLAKSDSNSPKDECLKKSDSNSPKDESLQKSDSNSKKELSVKNHCELCDSYFPLEEFALHVQDCLNKCYDSLEKGLDMQTASTSGTVLCLVCNKNIIKDLLNDHLEECMVSVFDKDNFKEEEDDNDEEPLNRTIYNCPICMENIDETNMNSHIDECLNAAAINNEFS